MELLEILLTIAGAALVGVLFYYVFRTTGPWGTFWSFILILILVGLAAEAWIAPIGPVYWDFSWVTTLFVILIFALLLAAASPARRRYTEAELREPVAREELEQSRESAVALTVFFWVMLFVLLIAVIWGFFA